MFQGLKTYLSSNHGFDEFGNVMNSGRPCVIQMDRYIEQRSVEKLLTNLYATRSEASPVTAMNHLYCFFGLSTKSEESKSSLLHLISCFMRGTLLSQMNFLCPGASGKTLKSNIVSLSEARDSDDDFNLKKSTLRINLCRRS